MLFSVSVVKLVNILFIATGIGICGLCFLQVTSSTHLKDVIKRYFQVFFLAILLYITMHLAREIMEGQPGNGIRIALMIVTGIEIFTAGLMAVLMSMLIVYQTQPKKYDKGIRIFLILMFGGHAILVMMGTVTGSVFFFDASNIYHRGNLYSLSSLAPMLMLILDSVLMIRYRDKFVRRVATAFWLYLLSPLVAIVIQSFTYGLQLIIFATVNSAVYMFSVIIHTLNEKFAAQQAETSRLETELSLAKRIQEDMLPNIFPAFPERKEFSIYASMKPAKEVGGDFYDYFFVDDNHLAMVMADVSGKGVPAALFMMISKILTENIALTGKSPGEVLEVVNNQICANNREEMFVTVWLGILDVKTGKLVASNAGHEYPVIKEPDGKFQEFKDKHGFVVGGMTGTKYSEYELTLKPGSEIFLYTDGVPEATDTNNQLFGTERMVKALNSVKDTSPDKVLAAVDKAVATFTKGAPQFDDMTMLCLQFIG